MRMGTNNRIDDPSAVGFVNGNLGQRAFGWPVKYWRQVVTFTIDSHAFSESNKQLTL